MTIADLMAWVNNPKDYKQGIAIVEALGCSATVVSILRKIECDYTRTKLMEEARSIIGRANAAVTAPRSANPNNSRIAQKQVDSSVKEVGALTYFDDTSLRKLNPDNLSPRLKELYYTAVIPQLRERAACHAKMQRNQPLLNEPLMHRIMEINDEIGLIYEQFNYFLEHGREKEIELSANVNRPTKVGLFEQYKAAVTREKSLREALSRLKSKGTDQEAIQAKKLELEEAVNEVKALDQKLSGL
jgi:hypothetical protein